MNFLIEMEQIQRKVTDYITGNPRRPSQEHISYREITALQTVTTIIQERNTRFNIPSEVNKRTKQIQHS